MTGFNNLILLDIAEKNLFSVWQPVFKAFSYEMLPKLGYCTQMDITNTLSNAALITSCFSFPSEEKFIGLTILVLSSYT